MPKRCSWVKMNNPLYIVYHDEEWGQPLHDDQALFELLCLETYQAGLSWETVLNKRQAFREAFHGYHLQGVADMTDEELEALLDNPAIIRNRAKIFATRANAQAFLQVQAEFGSFDAYLWSFVEGETINNDVPDYQQAWSMITRMIVNGKVEMSAYRCLEHRRTKKAEKFISAFFVIVKANDLLRCIYMGVDSEGDNCSWSCVSDIQIIDNWDIAINGVH